MRKWLAAAAVLGVGTTGMALAEAAAPRPGATGTLLARGKLAEEFTVSTKGPSDFVFQKVVIPPGGTTGWHTHDGRLLAVVKSGILTRLEADCSSRSYRPGEALVEPGGDDLHDGRNLGKEPVELYVTYVLPADGPLREDAPDPGCRS